MVPRRPYTSPMVSLKGYIGSYSATIRLHDCVPKHVFCNSSSFLQLTGLLVDGDLGHGIGRCFVFETRASVLIHSFLDQWERLHQALIGAPINRIILPT